MSNEAPEGGLRNHRTEFVREDDLGTTPSNPRFLKYSDTVTNFNWTSESVNEGRRGLGDADPTEFLKGPESHELVVAYDLVKWFESFTDPSGSSTLGVQSTDSSDTAIDVTITSEDGSTSETISTDATDATTFVTGSTSFSTVGKVELSASATGDIEIYTNSSGSPGTLLGTVLSGLTVEDNAGDAAYDALSRDVDNVLPHTHTIVDREEKAAVNAAQTVSGNTARKSRIYSVAKGAVADEVAVTGDPSDSQPVTVEITYLAQIARSFQIDQPTDFEAPTEIALKSTDAADTSQSVAVENEGGGTSEDVSLNGTTLVSSTSTYSDVDALELSAETEGDVQVFINTGSSTSPTAGDQIATIPGKVSYDGVQGDLGVPALGTGRRETLSNPGVETFIGDAIDRGGSPVPYEIPSMTVTVANNVEETERSSGYGMGLHPANREITSEATMYGEAMTHEMLKDHLQNNAKDIDWTMDGGTFTLVNAILQEPGERAAEEGQAVMTSDNTFQAEDVTFS